MDLGATDPVHYFISEWPNNDSTTTSEMIGEANRDSYIEYFYEDVGGGEDVLFVNAFTAVRGMHIVHADFTGLHSYPDLQPHSRDISDYGAMTPDAKFMLGTREINQVTATTQYNFNCPVPDFTGANGTRARRNPVDTKQPGERHGALGLRTFLG